MQANSNGNFRHRYALIKSLGLLELCKLSYLNMSLDIQVILIPFSPLPEQSNHKQRAILARESKRKQEVLSHVYLLKRFVSLTNTHKNAQKYVVVLALYFAIKITEEFIVDKKHLCPKVRSLIALKVILIYELFIQSIISPIHKDKKTKK